MLEFTQHAYSLLTRILFLVFLAFFTVSNGIIDLHSNACTDEQSTRNRKSFNFRKFGNASGLEQCVDFCCRDDICELAIFSRGFHCYGVSCDQPELCHKILDRLLMEDERKLQQNTRNAGTKDFIRHTSQVANPRCPKRFVPSFHVLLLGTSSPNEFRKLLQHSDVGSGQCSAQCCKSSDCLLSFIEDEECYGVTGAKTSNSTKAIQEPSIGLQVAIIDRNKEVSRSLDDEDDDPDDLGSDDSDIKQDIKQKSVIQTKAKQKHPKVEVKVQTTLTNKTSSTTNSSKTMTKTNSSNVSKKRFLKITPTKGSFQRLKNLITKLHVVHSSVGEKTIHSKASTKKRIIRPDIKLLPPTKGHSSHITSPVTKKRTINPKSIVKLAERNLSPSARPFKKASPSRANPTAKVTPASKGGKTTESRHGAQSTNTEGYSKIQHDVKHFEQTRKTVTVKKASSAKSRKSTARPLKRASPSKAKPTAKVTPATKGGKTTESRHGAQSTNTEGYSKIQHDVKHFEQTRKAVTVKKASSAKSRKSTTRPFKRASPYKAKPTAKVTPATKGGKTTESRHGAQSINTEGYSKIKHDVKHLEQTKNTVTVKKASSAKSRAWKTGTKNHKNTFKSPTKWHIPWFTGVLTEGSASGYEEWSGENNNLRREHRGFSGNDLELSGNDKYLGMEYDDFSGENSDLSGDDAYLSGDDTTLVREHNDFSGDHKDLRRNDKDSSGNDKDSSRNDKDSSGNDKDLMEDNDVLSGRDKDFLEDNDEWQEIHHRTMQDKTYEGEDKEEQMTTKSDLVKDLDELGSDEEDSDQSNKKQSKLVSIKVANLPQVKHVTFGMLKTKQNNEVDSSGQTKSERVNVHPKQQQHKETKQVSISSSKRITRPLHGKNSSKNGANIETRPLQSPLVKHRFSPLKRNANDRSGSGQKAAQDVEANGIGLNLELTTKKSSESDKKFKSRKEGSIETRDDHKRQRMIKATVTTTTLAKFRGLKNSSGRSIKPKNKNRFTKTSQSLSRRTKSGISKQGQITKKHKQVTNRTKSKEISRASSSRKTLKVMLSKHERKTIQNAIGTVHNRTTVPSPKIKMESVKDAVRSQKHLKSKDESSKSESILGNSNVKGDNTKTKHRKSLASEKNQDTHNLQSKEKQIRRDRKKPAVSGSYTKSSQKEGTRKFTTSNSTLEDAGDLMHYAHRKVSLKHKPSLNRHVQRMHMPTKKKTTFVKTTSPNQDVTVPKEGLRNYKINRNETGQAKRSYIHPKVRVLQKEQKSVHAKPTTSMHPRTATLKKRTHDKLVDHKSLVATPRTHSRHALVVLSTNRPKDVSPMHPTIAPLNERTHDKLVGHKSLVTTPRTHQTFAALYTNKPEHVSSNENGSLASHSTFSSSPQLISKETNSSAPIYTSPNNALLSIKQRSNKNLSDTKASFLSHFHQADSSGSDGVEFSVKSHGKHHRRKGKHEEAIDVEDLGDADFDIMMSNDIPRKDLPKKRKVKKRDHKHTENGEGNQRDTKNDVRGKKRKKGNSHENDEEHADADESENSPAKSHSSHKHKDKSEEIKESTIKHHHHHHHRDNADKDQGERKESHRHHRRHEKSTNSEQKDSESKNHRHNMHKKHSHLVKKIENHDDDDDSNSVESIHAKRHHKKVKTDASRKDDSENGGEKEHHHHHRHTKHYDDNHWEGKIIPGKVKLTYHENSDKKRHHKHRIQDNDENSEMKKEHHGKKHTLKEHEAQSDSDETETKKHHRHVKKKALHKHEHEDDDDERNEEHQEYRKVDQAKHQSKHRHKDKEEERAEKRTDVNYEVVKKDRHRLVHKENNDDDDSESSKRNDNDDNDDQSDEKQSNDDDSEENKGSAEGDDGSSGNTSHNRVVLGEDSESDDKDEEQHEEKSHKSHNRHAHRNEHRDNEREDAGYDVDDHDSTSHEEDHKPAFHSRHEQERQWESKHKHFESHEESNSNDDNDDDKDNIKNSRRNFRKSFIYHRKRKKQKRLRQHHEKESDREEEYSKDDQDEEFHVHKQHPSDIYKHHHYHHKPRDGNDNEKTETYEDRYEPKEPHSEDSFRHDERDYERNHEHNEEKMHDYEKQHEESEKFRIRDQMKNQNPNVEFQEHNGKHFHHGKERHHGDYISREEDHDARKFEDRNFPDFPHRHEQDSYKNRFIEGERPADDDLDHREDYNKGRKHEPGHRKKGHWKHRYFHEDDEQDLEGTGGSFDSSAWMRDENSDDHYYGGEGNREYQRHKHRKHKHRKHRQSYEYWAYREQNPYYYNYNYRKSRPRYEYYRPQPTVRPPSRWHKYHYGGYGRWKLKPTGWYRNKEQWDRKPSWRSFQRKPTLGYQWHTFYSDHGVTKQPKPTPYPIEPSHAWPPTNPRWQQPDQSQRGLGGDTWSPGHGRGPEKQYNDWSRNGPSAPLNQGGDNYRPLQNSPGLQPSRGFGASMPDRKQQPPGVQPNYVPPTQPNTNGVVSQTRFRPTVRRQYQAPPPSQIASPINITKIKSIMDKLNTPLSAVNGPQAGSIPTVNRGPVQNTANNNNGLLRKNLTSGDQIQGRNRLNGFFNEENGGKKKSDIVGPANVSHGGGPAARNSSSSANTSHHVQQTPPSITSAPAKPLHATQVANKTTVRYTTPTQTTSTSKPTEPAQNSSTTATPTHTTTTEQTPAGPNFGDVSQPDDSSETGKKHRKHRAPVCIAGKITDDVTLLRGKRAGNFTNIGDVGDFEMCIKRCCQHQKCDLAFKSAETCFLVNCFSKESCQTSPSLDDIFSPRMCFVTRHLKDDEKDTPGQDGDDEWNDKVSPSGIREVCDVEKALGLLWKKTIAGRYSAHQCPRGAKGFVKRRCEADSRWLPPDFSECVSKDYQTLFDKSKKLATGADPSPLIRELSQLTTQNIDNSLIFGGDLDRATDIMAAIVQHNGQTELIDMTREDVENFVRASSNLLDMTNLQEWFNIQKNKPGTADVLRSMEMFALQAAMRLPREDMAEPLITNNIIIKMDRKSPGDGGLTFPDFSNSKISRWDARHDIIALPSSVFDRGEVSTASISFKSLPYLLPDSNVSTGLGPNSKVISTVLHPHPQEKITPPVTVVLSHIKRRRGNPKCVFWDYTLNPHRGGAWSSRGCWLAFSNHSHSICQCSHLSNFAVLMDLSSDEVSQKEQKRERTMALMWIGIPLLIVGVIGGLYMSFSWNRKSGMPSTVTRPSAALNEKTGLLGQRVVTSQIREEFPASPTRDLYRALSPGYSPTGDLEWQDEFDFEMESGDQGFKQMLLPKLQMLQKQLINEFYDGDNMETKKKKLLESKIKQKSQITAQSPVQSDAVESVHRQAIQLKPQIPVQSPVQSDVVQSVKVQANPQTTPDSPVQCETVRTVKRQKTHAKSQKAPERTQKSQTLRIARRQMKTSSGRKLRVRFADEKPPGRNLTDEDKERFKRLQRMERRVFFQHLSRWTANSHLNLSD